MIKTPLQQSADALKQNDLVLDGYAVIASCMQNLDTTDLFQDTMHLEDHVLFFVLEGSLSLTHGKQTDSIGKNQMTLLKKGTAVQVEKRGNPDLDHLYHGMIFSLKEELIKSFLTSSEKITPKNMDGEANARVYPMTDCLVTFISSLQPYFQDSKGVYPGQLRLKIKEMLYNMAIGSYHMYQQILQLQQPVRPEIRDVIAQHYTSSISLTTLAELSGRSLSSFKRDFQAVYNTTPAAWIREKRLEKAKEMLETTQLPVADICFSLGFENVSHFSRIFKAHFKKAPTGIRTA